MFPTTTDHPTAFVAATSIQDQYEELVRYLLGAYLGASAESLIFQRSRYGKPFLIDGGDLTFNLSHSGSGLIMALARNLAIGVDLECNHRKRPILKLAKRFFCEAEFQALSELAPQGQREAFLYLWTAKEAVLKAIGRGLAFGLKRLEFEMSAGRPRRLLRIDAPAQPAADWRILNFSPNTGYCATLAWRGNPLRISGFCLIE